jgi:hypothetical protein
LTLGALSCALVGNGIGVGVRVVVCDGVSAAAVAEEVATGVALPDEDAGTEHATRRSASTMTRCIAKSYEVAGVKSDAF